MASRMTAQDKLAAIRAIRERPSSAADAAELRKFVGDRSNLVVAGAAGLVGERVLVELAGDLETAFDRFLVDPLKNDKLCRAKIADRTGARQDGAPQAGRVREGRAIHSARAGVGAGG